MANEKSEMVTVFTTAPEAYDYAYVEVVNPKVATDKKGKVFRELKIPTDRVEYQCGRYGSGLYPVYRMDLEWGRTNWAQLFEYNLAERCA